MSNVREALRLITENSGMELTDDAKAAARLLEDTIASHTCVYLAVPLVPGDTLGPQDAVCATCGQSPRLLGAFQDDGFRSMTHDFASGMGGDGWINTAAMDDEARALSAGRPSQATPAPAPTTRAEAEESDWRTRLTVNLLRQGAGLTKRQIRALIDHAVDGIEPDPALFPATPNLYIGACITDGRLHATVQRLESNGNVTLVATAEMDAASLHGHDCIAQMTPATSEPHHPDDDDLLGIIAEIRDAAHELAPELAELELLQAIGGPSEVPAYIKAVIGALKATHEPDTVPRAALNEVSRERDNWRQAAQTAQRLHVGDVWWWQGDGSDHPESMVNSLPVVIRAEQLRELLASPAPAAPALSKDQIREVFLAHGFTIKEGQTDLKTYVFEAAEALLKLAGTAPGVPEGFTSAPPTEQGWYWHWNGDEDSRPIPTSVLWSGSTGTCFVSRGQLGLSEAIDCDKYGGYWLKLNEPWDALAAAVASTTHPAPAVPVTDADALLDFMETHRVSVTPEYEGQWCARRYDDEPQAVAVEEGATPREALRALAAAQAKGGAA